jgi:site-specific DNA-methyltransferase (adenine-specific)
MASMSNNKILSPAFSTPNGVLYRADCMAVMPFIRSESVDCVFADPPFNLAKDYGNGSSQDDLESCDYLAWSKQTFDNYI